MEGTTRTRRIVEPVATRLLRHRTPRLPDGDGIFGAGEVDELVSQAVELAIAGRLRHAEEIAEQACSRGDCSALVYVALRYYLARDGLRAHRAWARAADIAALPPLDSIVIEGRPGLTEVEAETVRAWLQAPSRDAAARRLGVSPTTLLRRLELVRTKYAAAGRPVRSKAVLRHRAHEDGLLTAAR